MTTRRLVAALFALATAASLHIIAAAQSAVGGNVNIVTGIADQYIGDMYRQRQNEPVIGISSINPDHMVAAYNDYRTVDFATDQGVGTPAGQRTLFARLLDRFRKPARRDAAEEADAGQAWIGLSFSDNGGATWYTGLLPGHPSGVSADDIASPLRGYEAASDPVIAFTHNQFFIGGIAFSPGGGSAGFVSRLTDLNKSERGQNIHFDFTRTLLSVPDATRFVDKPSIAAGPNGHVYAAFVLFDNTDPKGLSSAIQFFRSSDYGQSWSAGLTLNGPRTRNQAPLLLVDPNNEQIVHVLWRVFSSDKGGGPEAIVYRQSTDGGASFSPAAPRPIANNIRAFDQRQVGLNLTTIPPTLPSPRSNAYPAGAIDGNGTLHVALQEWVNPVTGVPAPSGGVPRITVMSSKGGQAWSDRQAIDFGAGTGTQFMPVMTAVGEPGPSCAGGSGPRSRVMVMYYDARAANTNTYVAGGGAQFDVRIAEGSACTLDAAGRPMFGASQQMSRYSIDPRTKQIARTAGFNYPAVNRALEMFCGGNCAFTGDYIHLVPRVPYVNAGGVWKPTTARGVDQTELPAAVVRGVWADTRDVIFPTTPGPQLPAGSTFIDGLAWWNYQAPGTGKLPEACQNAGSRDQNVYAAEYSSGNLFAAAPVTFRLSSAPHSYPLYVENRAAGRRFFRVAIDPLANATFNLPGHGTPDRVSDIAIGPYSTVTGSVVVGANVSTPILITVAEIGAIGGSLLANGASTIVTLNTAGDATSQTEIHQPIVDATPTVTKPYADAGVPLPMTVCGTTSTTGCVPRTGFANPFTDNPFTDNPFTDNPFTDNPFTDNPFTDNVTVYDVTDVSFAITNGGNAAAAFAALSNVRNALKSSGSYVFKVFINRIGQNPGVNGCQTVETARDVQISAIKNPFTDNPFTDNPFTDNPFTDNPFTDNPFTDNASPSERVGVSNSTFYLAPPAAPGETAALRDRARADQRLASADRGAGRIRPAAFSSTATNAPAADAWRADRPADKVIYTLRAFQIKASNAPGFVPLDPTNDVGVLVTANTPNVVLVDGTPVFDPAGPPAATGGAAIPVKLTILQQPLSAPPGAPIAPAIQVAVQDGFGNTLTNSTLPITLAIANNPATGVLSGTLTQNAVNGIATFADASINQSGVGYTLNASSPGLTGATSTPFDILVACYAGSTAVQSRVTLDGEALQPLIVRPAQGIGGDANRDAAVLFGDGSFSLLQGNGAAQFPARFSAAVPGISGTARDMRVADLDLDGNPDLVLGFDGAAGSNLAIVRSDGAGAIIDSHVATTAGITALVAGQLDPANDAFPDVAWVSGASSTLYAWMGSGTVPFLAPKLRIFPLSGTQPVALALADMDGDASPDLVILYRGARAVEVLRSDGDGDFSVAAPLTSLLGGPGLRTPSDSPEALALGDFNEDGILDVAVATDAPDAEEGRAVIVLLGNGDGTLGAPVRVPIGASPLGLTIGDFNNDTHLDIATANPTDNNLVLLFGDGAGGFSAPLTATAGHTPRGIAVGDFNNDGLDDILVANQLQRAAVTYDEVSVLPYPCSGSGLYHVTSTLDAGAGTLRQAIANANARAGFHEITFKLPGTLPHTIALSSSLPPVTAQVSIDATTQPDYVGAPTVQIDGVAAGPGGTGLALSGSSMVRGLSLTGFAVAGIQMNSDGNVVSGNFIGLQPTGDPVPTLVNPFSVGVLSSGNNVVGGTGPRARNVITGSGYNVSLGNGVSWIIGNYIGTTPGGTTAGVTDLSAWGVVVGGTGHVIGGNSAARRNVISGLAVGIFVPNGSGPGVLVQGNYIGVDATGSAVLPTKVNSFGIEIEGGGVTVGGANTAEGNVISGYNTQVYAGFGGANTIQSNNVGSNAAGTVALPASVSNTAGVYLTSSNNVVSDNLITGHGLTGVAITSSAEIPITSDHNVVQNNRIVNNPGTGIMLTRDGSTFGVSNTLVPNVFTGNSGLAIDLDADGVTTNDALDGDAGTNLLQNYPVLDSATPSLITGTLTSTPNTSFTIHLFANSSCHASGYGGGEVYLGALGVTTGNSGIATFSGTFPVSVGQQVTATATSEDADTSEFSKCVTVTASAPPPGTLTFVVDNTNDSGPGSLRQAILDANANPDANEIVFNIPAPPYVIAPTSPLPAVSAPVLIDGATQPTYEGTPVVKIDGAGTGALDSGLKLLTGNGTSLIRGLAIGHFDAFGIQIQTSGNTIVNNYLGVDRDGATAIPNHQAGIAIVNATATYNTVGGTSPAERNVISGNTGAGVTINLSASDNHIEGNYIGTNAGGIGAVANGVGVNIAQDAQRNTIGGLAGGMGNLISGNTTRGVYIVDSSQNVVVGNLIGTDYSGTSALTNNLLGVHVSGTSVGNAIGSGASGGRNVISGHTFGVEIEGAGATGNRVLGNYIGTDAAGTSPIPNTNGGVLIANSAPGNAIGGPGPGEGNVISANGFFGVQLQGGNGAMVQGNIIGRKAGSAGALPNTGNGVEVYRSGNTIGGTAAGAANTIASNTGNGVIVSTDTAVDNAILSNSIFGNGGIGIDLGDDGVTSNDAVNPDTGPNKRQNYPAGVSASSTTVTAELFSAPGTTFTIQIFENDTANVEGRTIVRTLTVTTDSPGGHALILATGLSLTPGHYVTLTATDPTGNTSEFSAPAPVGP